MNSFDPLSQIPAISVVVPTTGARNVWLQKCVDSAIAGWQDFEIEIIIVLNSNLFLYDTLQKIFAHYPQVRLITSSPKGVSRARNCGLQAAKGILVRFLDDDDYLYPEMAVAQCKSLLLSKADISSYAIHLINENENILASRQPLDIDDCVVALANPHRLQIPVSFVFKRALVSECQWQEDLHLAEDTVWLLDLICKREIAWNRSEDVVGVWFQHNSFRLSKPHSTHQASQAVAKGLEHLSLALDARNSLSADRKSAIAAGMWNCYVAGFKYSPIYWSNIYQKIKFLDNVSTPDSVIYRSLNNLGISPHITSWLLLPGFLALLFVRKILSAIK